MSRILWAPEVVRQAGCPIVVHDGFNGRGFATFGPWALVWHHDASAVGYSPGMPAYMIREMDAGRNGAQIWVTLDGTWHFLASGRVNHAGEVLSGKPSNRYAAGIETDHTTGETWSGVKLLHSLRVGSAAILKHQRWTVDRALEFHKTICKPVGRKTDPDGLDLGTERRAVQDLLVLPPPSTPTKVEDMIVIPSAGQPSNGRLPFFELRPVDADTFIVVSHNGAKLLRVDGTTPSGLWFLKQEQITGVALGIHEWQGKVYVGCAGLQGEFGGGTYQVSA